MFIHVGGVPASGKSTIINNIYKLSKNYFIPLQKVSGSKIMAELAGVNTIEEMRALPEKLRASFRPEMYRRLYEEDKNDPTTIRLVDGHFVLFDVDGKDFGIHPLMPEDKDQMLAMVLIQADPETIRQRRLKDMYIRPDRQTGLDFIKKEQSMELEIAISYTSRLNVPLAIIHNPTEIGQNYFSKYELAATYGEPLEAHKSSIELMSYIKMWHQQIKP